MRPRHALRPGRKRPRVELGLGSADRSARSPRCARCAARRRAARLARRADQAAARLVPDPSRSCLLPLGQQLDQLAGTGEMMLAQHSRQTPVRLYPRALAPRHGVCAHPLRGGRAPLSGRHCAATSRAIVLRTAISPSVSAARYLRHRHTITGALGQLEPLFPRDGDRQPDQPVVVEQSYRNAGPLTAEMWRRSPAPAPAASAADSGGPQGTT